MNCGGGAREETGGENTTGFRVREFCTKGLGQCTPLYGLTNSAIEPPVVEACRGAGSVKSITTKWSGAFRGSGVIAHGGGFGISTGI